VGAVGGRDRRSRSSKCSPCRPEQVERAAAAARLNALLAARPLEPDDLRAGARAQNASGLERLARRIAPRAGWTDLVLPDDAVAHLRELAARAAYRELVLDGWGLAGPGTRGRGIAALFAGDSGTGKTLAAEVLAQELGLDLYAIDLATVVDKYVGETEKNLDRIFGEAERVHGVLFFDEADALFGKRSEVRDAHDRYANVEVAYLLQRMEAFDGVAILATNLRANIDDAFARRLDALVDFPMPDVADRRRLWQLSLGSVAPRADDLDLDFCSRAFELSGGNIRNIVVAAAYVAAAAGRPIAMDDLIHGTRREYRKLGRLLDASEFGAYHVPAAV
jgi:SpoVK/Ycf46/Vps4 family AAA+-type ATPase